MAIRKIIFALLVAVPAFSLQEDSGFYVVATKFVKFVEKYRVKSPLQVFEDKALVTLTASERDDLVNAVHENQSFCAGVTDVSDEYVQSQNKENFLREFSLAQTPNFMADNYEIKHETQARNLIDLVDAAKYEEFIRKYIAFPDRYSNSETGKQASEYLKAYSENLAKAHGRNDVEVQEVTAGKNYLQKTIYARIRGTDSTLPGILIGGHMDTLRSNKPGADDDASGTTVVAELYRAVLDSGMKFKRDIYFTYYAAEEVGLVGSNVMAKQFKSSGVKLRGVLQFDMVGYNAQEPLPMHFVEDNVSNELTQFTKDLAVKYLGLKTREMGTTLCNYECSDHASWNRQGYPSAFPFESSFDNMNHKIHTAKDNMDTVNVEHAIRFVKLGAAWIAEMGEAE